MGHSEKTMGCDQSRIKELEDKNKELDAKNAELTKEKMAPIDFAAIKALCGGVALPTDKETKEQIKLVYGTAGFRTKAVLLDSTCLRMGLLAVLRAMRKGAPVGIMAP